MRECNFISITFFFSGRIIDEFKIVEKSAYTFSGFGIYEFLEVAVKFVEDFEFTIVGLTLRRRSKKNLFYFSISRKSCFLF